MIITPYSFFKTPMPQKSVSSKKKGVNGGCVYLLMPGSLNHHAYRSMRFFSVLVFVDISTLLCPLTVASDSIHMAYLTKHYTYVVWRIYIRGIGI